MKASTAGAERVDLRGAGLTTGLGRFGRAERGEGDSDAVRGSSSSSFTRLLAQFGRADGLATDGPATAFVSITGDDARMSLSVRSLLRERIGLSDGGRRRGGV